MRIVRKSIILFLVILIIFSVSSSTAAVEEIIVNSEAEIKSDLDLAKEEALQKAFQKAVRKAAGIYIRKSTLLENSKLISQRIYSKAEGYIADYELISEKRTNNKYQLQLKAVVAKSFLEELEELKVILKNRSFNPRLLVLLKQDFRAKKAVNEFQARAQAIESNFRRPEFEQQAFNYHKFLKSELKEIGFELAEENAQAEYDILVQLNFQTAALGSKNLAAADLKIQSGKSRINIYSRKRDKRLLSFTVFGKAYARDQAQAAALAVEKTAQNAAEQLTKRLLPLIDLNSGQKKLELKLENVEYQNLAKFESLLFRLGGIKNFRLLRFKESTAEYELNVLQSSSVLARRLTNEKNLKLKVIELGTDYLKLQLN